MAATAREAIELRLWAIACFCGSGYGVISPTFPIEREAWIMKDGEPNG